MMFKNALFASLALLPSAIVAHPAANVARQAPPEVSCDTSENSPYVRDAEMALNILNQKGDVQCVNLHNGGSDCNELQRSDTALITMCGDEGLSIACRDAVYYLQQIYDNCVVDGRVGGSYQIGGGAGWNRVQFQHT